MAEEVGQGYVSVVPSMKNFSKLVKAELAKSFAGGQLEIAVKPVFDKSALGKMDPISVPVTPEFDPAQYRARLATMLKGKATQQVDIDIDKNVGSRIFSKIFSSADVDIDKDRLQKTITGGLGSLAGAGQSAGQSFLSGMTSVLTSPTTGILALIALPFAALPVAIVGALATAGGVLAGGGIGALLLGGFALRDDPELKKALSGLGTSIDKGLTEAAQPLKGPFLEALSTVGEALKYIAPDVKSFFKTIAESGGIKELANGVSGFIKALSDTGALDKLATAIGPMLTQIGMALPDIGNALSQFIISVTKVAPQATDFIGKLLRYLADIIRFAGDAIEWLSDKWTMLQNAFAFAKQIVADTISGLKLFWEMITGNNDATQKLLAAFSSFAEWLRGKWAEIWGNAKSAVTNAVAGVVATAKGIPGQITSALGNLGSLLWSGGANLIQGLIDGIKSKLGAIGSVMSMVTSKIGGFLPHSPAKWGPLSGSGSPELAGQTIATMLAGGMTSKLPAVTSAASGLAGAVAYGSGSRAAGATAAGTTLLIDSAGSEFDDALVGVLRMIVSNRAGGNVQQAFGVS